MQQRVAVVCVCIRQMNMYMWMEGIRGIMVCHLHESLLVPLWVVALDCLCLIVVLAHTKYGMCMAYLCVGAKKDKW